MLGVRLECDSEGMLAKHANIMSDSETPDAQHVSSEVDGNASLEVKKIILDTATNMLNGIGFASIVGRRLSVKEISYIPKAEEPRRMECRVTVEITVDNGKFRCCH
jgi:hypothetical protein